MKQQGGFTLIELVTVIVILGILSAFALPRFAGLEAQARFASLQGLAGSVRAASALAHSLAIANGSSDVNASVSMEGQIIGMVNRYPSLVGIENALQSTDGYTYDAGTGIFTVNGAGPGSTCTLTYGESGAVPAPPSIIVNALDFSVCQ